MIHEDYDTTYFILQQKSKERLILKNEYKELKKFLVSYRIPVNSLDKIAQESLKAKKKLNKILGLNQGNQYRTILWSEDPQKMFCTRYSIIINKMIRFITKNDKRTINEYDIPNNSLTFEGDSNVYKISRILNRNLNSLWPELLKGPSLKQFSQEIGREISKDTFLTNFFGAAKDANAGSDPIYISTNFNDIINNSSSSWDNCYRPLKCYFGACTAIALDKFTAITYRLLKNVDVNDNSNNKRYRTRAWIHIKNKSYFINRCYGEAHYTYDQHNILETYLQDKIKAYLQDPKLKFSTIKEIYRNISGCDNAGDSGSTAVYFDGANFGMRRGVVAGNRYAKLDFPHSKCFYCGQTVNYSRSDGMCNACGHKYDNLHFCSECFIGHEDPSALVNVTCKNDEGEITTEKYCKKCAKKIALKCNHCNEFFSNIDMISVNGKNYCSSCYKNEFHKCDVCDKLHYKNAKALARYGEYTICNTCTDAAEKKGLIKKCNVCGLYKNVKGISKEGHCSTCQKLRVITCPICGKNVLHNKTTVCSPLNPVEICNSCIEQEKACKYCGHRIKDGVCLKTCVGNKTRRGNSNYNCFTNISKIENIKEGSVDGVLPLTPVISLVPDGNTYKVVEDEDNKPIEVKLGY